MNSSKRPNSVTAVHFTNILPQSKPWHSCKKNMPRSTLMQVLCEGIVQIDQGRNAHYEMNALHHCVTCVVDESSNV